MPDISDRLMRKQWDEALDLVMSRAKGDWDKRFVRDMRRYTDDRDELNSFGLPSWNPTVRQWNQLMSMRDKFK